MAKELIATLITNSNGEAFYTYTGTGAGETTFIAESGDLESEPLVINDILERITLTADKNILSYADNDFCTLTADVIGVENEKTVHTYTDTNYHKTPQTYALQLNSNSHIQGNANQAEFHINGKTGTMYTESMWGTSDIGQFNVEKPIFFDLNNSSLYYYDQNNQLVIIRDNYLYPIAWKLEEGDSFDVIEYPFITFKSNILKSNIVDSNSSYSYSSHNILLDINLSNMGSNITIQKENNSIIEISKNNDIFTITYDGKSFDTNNPNLKLIRDAIRQGWYIKKENEDVEWDGYSNISNIDIDSGFIVINEYYYQEVMSNPYEGTDVTYYSQGAGDVTITAECMNLQETYDIKDAIKYYNGTLTTTTVISVPNLPTDFEMSWKAIRQSGKTAYMKFGLSEAHVIYGGIIGTDESRNNVGIYRYVSGQGNKEGGMINNYIFPTNVEKTLTMRHENNVASISVDGKSTSFTNTALTSRDYVRADISGGSIKEILIMPL